VTIVGEGRDNAAGVAVEVFPGGGLRSLTLSDRALRLGGDRLAATIVRLVDLATARANQSAHNAIPSLDGLGLDVDPALAEDIELTTPDTWMR
jgi:hypothetical protein